MRHETPIGPTWLYETIDRASAAIPDLSDLRYRAELARQDGQRGRVAVLRAAALRLLAEQLLVQARDEISRGMSAGVSQAETARLTSLSRQRVSQLAAEARARGWQIMPGGVQTPLC